MISVHLAIIPDNSNVHILFLRIYLSTVSTSVEGKQLVCNFLKLFLCSSVIHVDTAPAFTHFCRCCLSLECILVDFLNQNPCMWSGHAAFQLDILAIAHFSSFTVMITFSCFGVSQFLFHLLRPLRISIVLHWFRPYLSAKLS